MTYRRLGIKELQLYFGMELPELDGLYDWRTLPVTENQKRYIHNLGINISGIKYRGHASKIISEFERRREKCLATPKQIAFLIKANQKVNFQTITKSEAGDIITKYISMH